MNLLPALLGEKKQGRTSFVEYANTLAIRQGDWKYVRPSKGAKYDPATRTEFGNDLKPQLYNLSRDPGEKHNVFAEYPEVGKRLAKLLDEMVAQGRTRNN